MTDKAIINPEDNLQLSKDISDILSVYRETHNINCSRGYCYNTTRDFMLWVHEEIPELEDDFEIIYGWFYIDDPIGLPLTIMDLDDDEREKFYNFYKGIDIPDTDYYDEENMKELSQMIWDFASIELAFEDDWNIYDHSWIEIQGLIIDLTKEQFTGAVNGRITKDRYIKEFEES
jgi:hypothetical protein